MPSLIEEYVDVNCPECGRVISEVNCNRCGTMGFSTAEVKPATDFRKVDILIDEARVVLDTLDGAGFGQATVADDCVLAMHKALRIVKHPHATVVQKATGWHIYYIASVVGAACARSNAEQTGGDLGMKDGYVDLESIAAGCIPVTTPPERVNVIVDNEG